MQTNTHKYCTPCISSQLRRFLHLVRADLTLSDIFLQYPPTPSSPHSCKGPGSCSHALLTQDLSSNCFSLILSDQVPYVHPFPSLSPQPFLPVLICEVSVLLCAYNTPQRIVF